VITFDSSGSLSRNNSLKMIGSADMLDRLYILKILSYHKLQIKLVKSPHITNTMNFTASDFESL